MRCLVLILVSFACLVDSSARILRTRPTPSETWNPWVPLTLGSGVEFESDKDQSQIEFPMLLEYNFIRVLKLSLEPDVVYLEPKKRDARRVAGLGDLETALEYEFITERRYRPAITAIGSIKWPTASEPGLGSPGRDYSLGIIASKDLVFIDIDLGALYTFVGDRTAQDTLELSAACEWHLNHLFDIEAEIVHSFGKGGIRGRAGSLSGIGSNDIGNNLTEGTLGLAWRVTKRLKLEQGGVIRSDGTSQIVFAWEFSFGGD